MPQLLPLPRPLMLLKTKEEIIADRLMALRTKLSLETRGVRFPTATAPEIRGILGPGAARSKRKLLAQFDALLRHVGIID